ncbi:hypothetical protein RUM44_006722 [Polyplax serrata]|uniref:C2H2-type domain-containing protein n=1 Tax=Polyplax serrata TaxID=468196 RepID=A0ABR1AIY0_POLSC
MESVVQLEQEKTSNQEDGTDAENKVPTEKSRQCPICHVYYKYGNSYWQHVRYVHASFLCQCIICEKCYKRTTMAKHHVLHSHKIAWHLCGNYVRKIRKSELQQKQDGLSENPMKNIGQKFYRKKILHLIQAFNCYDCSSSFTTINELFEHVKIHKDSKENDTSDETSQN